MGFGLNLELYPSISDPEGLQILEPLPPEKQQLFLLLFYLFPYSWLLKISALSWKAATLGHKIHCPLFSLVFNVLLLSSRFFFFFLFPLSFQVAERSLKKKKRLCSFFWAEENPASRGLHKSTIDPWDGRASGYVPGKAAGSPRQAARCSPVEKLPPAAWICGRIPYEPCPLARWGSVVGWQLLTLAGILGSAFNAAQVEAWRNRLPSFIPSDCRAEGVRGWIWRWLWRNEARISQLCLSWLWHWDDLHVPCW